MTKNTIKDLLKKKKNCKNQKERAQLIEDIASLYFTQGDINNAIDQYKELLQLWKSKDARREVAKTHRLIADCAIELEQFTKALVHARAYLKLSIECDEKIEVERAHVTIGRVYVGLAEQQKDGRLILNSLRSAASSFLTSLKLVGQLSKELEMLRINEMRAVSLINLGLVYKKLLRSTEAHEQLMMAVNIATKSVLPDCLFRALVNLADNSLNTSIDKEEVTDSTDFLTVFKLKTSEVLSVVSSSLALARPQEQSASLRALKENALDSLGQLYLVSGRQKKAAKLFSALASTNKTLAAEYNRKRRESLLLHRLSAELAEAEASTRPAKLEQIADAFSRLQMYGPALFHYLHQCRSLDALSDASDAVQKTKAAALVSVAESYKSVGDMRSCALFYRKQIDLLRLSRDGELTDVVTSQLEMANALRASFEVGATSKAKKLFQVAWESVKDLRDIALQRSVLETAEDFLVVNEPDGQLLGEYRAVLMSLPEEVSRSDEAEVDQPSPDYALPDDTCSSDSEIDALLGLRGQAEEVKVTGPRKVKTKMTLNEKGETPLHVAAINGEIKRAETLIKRYSQALTTKDAAGWLPIHDAAFNDQTDMVGFLLDNGSPIDCVCKEQDNSTPLFEAVHGEAFRTARLLVARGANLWHRNACGETLSSLLANCEPSDLQKKRELAELMSELTECLGASYQEWLRLRGESSDAAAVRREPELPRLARRHRLYSSSSSDSEEEVAAPVRRAKPSRPAVSDYRAAIRMVGSSAVSGRKRSSFTPKRTSSPIPVAEEEEEENSPKRLKETSLNASFQPRVSSTQLVLETPATAAAPPQPASLDLPKAAPSRGAMKAAKITFPDVSVIVPIMCEEDHTIAWLAREACSRRAMVTGKPAEENVRLQTADGVALVHCDPISILFVGQSDLVELGAEIVAPPEKVCAPLKPPEPQLDARGRLMLRHLELRFHTKSLLDLSYGALGNEQTALLCRHFVQSGRRVETAILDGNGLTELGELFGGLCTLPTLRQLHLRQNKLTPASFCRLFRSLVEKGQSVILFPQLEMLDISHCVLPHPEDCDFVEFLLALEQMCPLLQSLKMRNANWRQLPAPLTMRDATTLKSLRVLDLSWNPLGADAFHSLVMNCLRFRAPIELNLRHCRGGDALVDSVERCVSCCVFQLQALDLSDCCLTPDCLPALQKLLDSHNGCLRQLVVTRNPCLKGWHQLFHTCLSANCKLAQLQIDLPRVTDAEEVDERVECVRKVLLGDESVYPIQQLTLHDEQFIPTWNELQTDSPSWPHRLLHELFALFQHKYQTLHRIRRTSPATITFGIRV